MADGAEVRTLLLPHEKPLANLLLLTGRADFFEKWAHAITLLHEAGFAIATFDWRGQGGSTRLSPNGAGHIDSFDTWLSDLDCLSQWASEALPGPKWMALAHSMGGHLLTRWAADPKRAHLDLRQKLDAVVLAAPFFGLGGSKALKLAAQYISPWQVARGKASEFAWGQTPYGKLHQLPQRQLRLTASRAHFEDEGLWIAANPELATGGVSWGWLKAFADSEAALEALPLEEFSYPLLLLLAGREKLVDNKAALRVISRLPRWKVHEEEKAAHELLREADEERRHVMDQITRFAREHCR